MNNLHRAPVTHAPSFAEKIDAQQRAGLCENSNFQKCASIKSIAYSVKNAEIRGFSHSLRLELTWYSARAPNQEAHPQR